MPPPIFIIVLKKKKSLSRKNSLNMEGVEIMATEMIFLSWPQREIFVVFLFFIYFKGTQIVGNFRACCDVLQRGGSRLRVPSNRWSKPNPQAENEKSIWGKIFK